MLFSNFIQLLGHMLVFKLYLFLVKLYKLQYNRVLHVDKKKYIKRLIIINIFNFYIIIYCIYNIAMQVMTWFDDSDGPFPFFSSQKRKMSWVNLGL